MPNAPRSSAPPPGFDPAKAKWQDLYEYGIPEKPDQTLLPELNKAWRRLFERPAAFECLEYNAIQPRARHKHVACGARSYQKTGNWCGALIPPDPGSQCVLMFGEWTVPKLWEAPPSLQPQDGLGTYHCVTWIGLDGDRSYFNASLPQVGTEQVITTADCKTECSAWFQWWARDQQQLTAFKLENLSIEPGVTVMAMIWAFEPHNVSVAFRTCSSEGTNQKDKLVIFTVESPEVALSRPANQFGRPEISGATAEWIMERPQTPELVDASFLPFPRHDTVQFSNCVAGNAPVNSPGATTASGPRQACSEKLLVRPRLIRLFESVSDPTVARTRLLSLPYRLSNTSIEVRYCGDQTTPQEMTALTMPKDGRNKDAHRQVSGREYT